MRHSIYEVPQKGSLVMVTLAYSEYKPKNHYRQVIDYLPKPVTHKRFQVIIKKAQERISSVLPGLGLKQALVNQFVFITTD